MNQTIDPIMLVEIVGSPNCVDIVDGNDVYSVVSDRVGSEKPAIVSFEGVDRITTAFLNAAIGQLYNEFSEEQIRRNIKFSDISPASSSALTKVIERAKKYFADPEKFNRATRKVFDED